MRIGIAGVGGIGSNVAINLVRSGVDWLRIVDFDRVEASNLNRQFYFFDQIGRLKTEALAENLRRIRADIRIETVAVRIDATNCLNLFADCPLVVEGLDRRTDKKMLLEALAGGGRTVVSACGIAPIAVFSQQTAHLVVAEAQMLSRFALVAAAGFQGRIDHPLFKF